MMTSESGKRIPTVGGGAKAEAFVPDPLPPKLTYSPGLALALAEANRHLGELSGAARHLPNPHLLIRPFLRKEAVLSSRIEGTEADIADLYVYESGQKSLPGLGTEAPYEDIQEVVNYAEALEYGLARLDSLPMSLRLIREIHGRLLSGVRGRHRTPGEFRRDQNWIGPAGCRIDEARYVPPPVPEMTEALKQFELYVHSDAEEPPLVRLGLIHYQFEAIHPFLDGNGRIGRLLIILLLVHWKLLPLPLLYLSAFFEKRRSDYYELLKNVSHQSAWHEWLQFFLEGIAVQSKEAARLALTLQEQQMKWRQAVTDAGASSLLGMLTDSLLERPILTIPDAARRLDVTYPTAKNIVDRLLGKGILRLVPATYPKRFIAPRILELLMRDDVDESTSDTADDASV